MKLLAFVGIMQFEKIEFLKVRILEISIFHHVHITHQRKALWNQTVHL